MDELTKYIADFLNVLSDPIRLEIVRLLKNKEYKAKQLEEELGISQSYTSQQLKVLKKAGLIEVTKDGNIKNYSIGDKKIYNVLSVIKSLIVEKERQRIAKL